MHVYIYPLGELQANCYLLEQNGACLIVDPGDSADFIAEQIQRRNITVKGIVLTHGHFDHAMAAGELQMSYAVPVYRSPADQFLLNRLSQTAEHFLRYSNVCVPMQNMVDITHGKTTIGPFSFSVIPTPGHTPGSICLYFEKPKMLFSGDTLFYHVVGAVDHSYSNATDLQTSLRTLFRLPENTLIYPGHGQSSTIGEEKKIYGLQE